MNLPLSSDKALNVAILSLIGFTSLVVLLKSFDLLPVRPWNPTASIEEPTTSPQPSASPIDYEQQGRLEYFRSDYVSRFPDLEMQLEGKEISNLRLMNRRPDGLAIWIAEVTTDTSEDLVLVTPEMWTILKDTIELSRNCGVVDAALYDVRKEDKQQTGLYPYYHESTTLVLQYGCSGLQRIALFRLSDGQPIKLSDPQNVMARKKVTHPGLKKRIVTPEGETVGYLPPGFNIQGKRPLVVTQLQDVTLTYIAVFDALNGKLVDLLYFDELTGDAVPYTGTPDLNEVNRFP